ncbi:MAG TPA: hypothetical protein PLU30_10145 [Verrucomicrobiae bacterium]|nr:hypothetical protein [Verrucomicrobiae bacterium]
MLRLFSGLCTLVGFLVLVVAGLFFFRDRLASRLLESAVERETGLTWTGGTAEVNLAKATINIKGLELVNPGHFPERRCLDIPSAKIEFDLERLQSGHLVVRKLTLDIARLVIVRTALGELNLERIKALVLSPEEKRPAGKSPIPPHQFLIERVEMSAERIEALDFSASPNPPPLINEIKLSGIAFTNIQNGRDLQRAVLTRILQAASVKIPGFDLERLAALSPKPAKEEPTPTAPPTMGPILPKLSDPTAEKEQPPAKPVPAPAGTDAPAFPIPAPPAKQ